MSEAVQDRPASGPDRMCLFHVASGQAGYFTAEQARGCGYSRALLSHHARSGRFIRARYGLGDPHSLADLAGIKRTCADDHFAFGMTGARHEPAR